MLTGCTSWPAIRRSDASPEAEMTSYCPVRMSVTASSEVPNGLKLTLHWVSCSNGCTQSTAGSLLPSSTYPGHPRMDSWPSPGPISVLVGCADCEEPDPPLVPQPDSMSAAAATTPTTREAFVLGAMILTFRWGVNRRVGGAASGAVGR